MIYKIRHYSYLFLILIAFTIIPVSLNAVEIGHEVISEGYFNADDRYQSMVVNDKDTLDKIMKQQGVNKEAVSIDLKKETLALIVPEKSSYPDRISIEEINKNNQDIINLSYSVVPVSYVPEMNEKLGKPFKLIKIFPAAGEHEQVCDVSFLLVELVHLPL